MPVYNGEGFIAEAVVSVLESRFTDFELLVVDDGCTDRSIAEVRRAAAGDPRVRVVLGPHAGIAAARNYGLDAARGEFIANLDADDEMYPDRLTRQVAYLDRHPECVAVGCRALFVDRDGAPLRVAIRAFTHEEIDGAHLGGRGGALGNPAATFRRGVAIAVGGYDATLRAVGEDHDLWLRMAEAGRLANLPDVLIRYRIHDANASVGDHHVAARRAATLASVDRALVRRGIPGRADGKPPQPVAAGLRWSDRALLGYYRGRRWRSLLPAFAGWLRNPAHPATRWTLRTILSRRAPTR